MSINTTVSWPPAANIGPGVVDVKPIKKALWQGCSFACCTQMLNIRLWMLLWKREPEAHSGLYHLWSHWFLCLSEELREDFLGSNMFLATLVFINLSEETSHGHIREGCAYCHLLVNGNCTHPTAFVEFHSPSIGLWRLTAQVLKDKNSVVRQRPQWLYEAAVKHFLLKIKKGDWWAQVHWGSTPDSGLSPGGKHTHHIYIVISLH